MKSMAARNESWMAAHPARAAAVSGFLWVIGLLLLMSIWHGDVPTLRAAAISIAVGTLLAFPIYLRLIHQRPRRSTGSN